MLQLHKLPHLKLLQVSDWEAFTQTAAQLKLVSLLFPRLAGVRLARSKQTAVPVRYLQGR